MDPHDAYLAARDEAARARLLDIRAAIEARVPGTSRCMAYQMPALKKDRVVIYFASFKHHIGIYPPVTAPSELVAELEPWRGPKGNLSFPHKDPLPLDLITRVGEALAAHYGQDGV